MDIFTKKARLQLVRTIASCTLPDKFDSLDFLDDDAIWKECWHLLERTQAMEERMVPPERIGSPPLSFAGEKILSVFFTLSSKDSLFTPEARKHLALLPHDSGRRFQVNESGRLEERAEGAKEKQWSPSTDTLLWLHIVDAARQEIECGSEGGIWLRNYFRYVEIHGEIPPKLRYEEEEDDEDDETSE